MRQAKKKLRFHTQAGVLDVTLEADLPGYGVVPFSHEGVANTLSLHKASKKHKITFNKNGFLVETPNGKRVFDAKSGGLHAWDVRDGEKGVETCHIEEKPNPNNVSLVTTVEEKKRQHAK